MTNLTTPGALIEAGLATPAREAEWRAVAERYAILAPPALAALIDPADPDDPIALQILPDGRELVRLPHELDDPIGDDLKSPTRGLVHRYRDRVLLKLNAVCAVYCRFCFRRESVGPGAAGLDAADFAAALDYIRARPEIWEVVLTGGDPLAARSSGVGHRSPPQAAAASVRDWVRLVHAPPDWIPCAKSSSRLPVPLLGSRRKKRARTPARSIT